MRSAALAVNELNDQIRPGDMGLIFWQEADVNETGDPDLGTMYITKIAAQESNLANAAFEGFFCWLGTEPDARGLDPDNILHPALKRPNVRFLSNQKVRTTSLTPPSPHLTPSPSRLRYRY